jgi:cellulose synthase operon protein C
MLGIGPGPDGRARDNKPGSYTFRLPGGGPHGAFTPAPPVSLLADGLRQRASSPRPMRPLSVPVLLAVLLAFAPAGQAQGVPPPPPEADGAAARFQLADAFIRQQQFDRAIAVLEDLLAEQPGAFPVFDRLKTAYLGARRYDDAARLVEGQMAHTGRTPVMFAELGAIHLAAGRRAEADAAWRQAVAAAPDHVQTYRTLYAVLVQQRLWEEARDALLEGRRRLRQQDLFRLELADLHARSGGYAEALEEWAAVLGEDPARFSFVQARMSRLLDQDGAAGAFREALDRLIRREPMRLPYRRLAAWLASETGAFDAALDHTRALDRLGQERGESLLAFAETAQQAGALDASGRAYDLLLELHADTPSGAMALLAAGRLAEARAREAGEEAAAARGEAEGLPHYTRARERYAAFLEVHARHPAAPQAMQQLARLERDVFRDYDAAERLLAAALAGVPPEASGPARLALGEVAILRGDLRRARLAFQQVESELRTGEPAERARLELALLDFYEGNHEMALARVEAMTRNTATDVANNAIDLRLLLSENQGPDSLSTPLRQFAQAELLHRQRRPAEALAALDGLIAQHAEHALADELHFRRGQALRTLGRSREAHAVLAALPEQFPESYLADRALFVAAEVQERDLADPDAAATAYTRFLVRYPGSLLAPEARARARRLRGDRPS